MTAHSPFCNSFHVTRASPQPSVYSPGSIPGLSGPPPLVPLSANTPPQRPEDYTWRGQSQTSPRPTRFYLCPCSLHLWPRCLSSFGANARLHVNTQSATHLHVRSHLFRRDAPDYLGGVMGQSQTSPRPTRFYLCPCSLHLWPRCLSSFGANARLHVNTQSATHLHVRSHLFRRDAPDYLKYGTSDFSLHLVGA